MKIKLKHSSKKCWACKRQAEINEMCKNKDFSIEFDFYKSAGTVVPIITYIARKFIKEKGFVCISLRAMPEIEEYTRKSSIDLIPSLSKGGIEHLIRQAEKSYQDVLKK